MDVVPAPLAAGGVESTRNLDGTDKHLSPIFLLISNLINKLRLHHFLGTKTTETNQSLKTDASIAY